MYNALCERVSCNYLYFNSLSYLFSYLFTTLVLLVCLITYYFDLTKYWIQFISFFFPLKVYLYLHHLRNPVFVSLMYMRCF